MAETIINEEKKCSYPSTLLKDLSEKLKEEKWTRASIESYSNHDFIEFDKIIDQIKEESLTSEVRNLCMEHLRSSSQSIIALYLVGMLMYEEKIIDETHIINLIELLKTASKWKSIEQIASKSLQFGESKYILSTLEEYYSKEKDNSKLVDLWLRLNQVDYENGIYAFKLAQYYQDEDDIPKALSYYKMALMRFCRRQNLNYIEKIWKILIQLDFKNYDFFFKIQKELAKYNKLKAEELLKYLIDIPHVKKDLLLNIKVFKQILLLNPKEKDIRGMLINLLHKQYEKHPQVLHFIEISNLKNLDKDINQCLDLFYKYIAFEENNFVYHRSWGIGKIIHMNENSLFIDFEKKNGHEMSLGISLSSLKVIDSDHIWIKKKEDPDFFKDFTPERIKEVLVILFNSYNNIITMKDMKKEILPLIGKGNWLKWWNKARQVMKLSSLFGNSKDDKSTFFLREKPLSFEEETVIHFNNSFDFNQKLNIILDYMKNSSDYQSESFRNMLNYFVNICNRADEISERIISSYLFLRKIQKSHPNILFELKISTNHIINAMSPSTLMEIYLGFASHDLRKDFILILQKNHPQWQEIFFKLILLKNKSRSNTFISECLYLDYKKTKNPIILTKFKETFNFLIENYRKHIANFFWFIEHFIYNKNFKELTQEFNYSNNKLLFNLFHCLDILNKDILIKKNLLVKDTKKIFNAILEFLSNEELIKDYVESLSLIQAKKMIALINGITNMNLKHQTFFTNYIYQKFPELIVKEKKSYLNADDFIVTRASYEKKQKELYHLINVEIPENSKAIGLAQEKGDLRENAEYSAALEHQKYLQKLYEGLSEELNHVKIINADEVEISRVNPGTYVELENLKNHQLESYTILGEWESNLEKHIISYRSPFGQCLLGHKVKEIIQFNYTGVEKRYLIKKIEKAKFI